MDLACHHSVVVDEKTQEGPASGQCSGAHLCWVPLVWWCLLHIIPYHSCINKSMSPPSQNVMCNAMPAQSLLLGSPTSVLPEPADYKLRTACPLLRGKWGRFGHRYK
jgi:hypothetical protein